MTDEERNALRLVFNGESAHALEKQLKSQGFPDARAFQVRHLKDEYHVEVSPGRFVILEDDLHANRTDIIRAVIRKAKQGDLKAIRFLLKHSDFAFPSFKVNGDDPEDEP